MRFQVLVAAATIALGLVVESRGDFNQIVAFGDSLSDAGNVFLATSGTTPNPNYYSNGRYTNGAVWVQNLSLKFNSGALTPNLSGGFDYAWGGAFLHNTNNGLSAAGTPNTGTQIAAFLGDHGSFTSNQLVTLWAGANDILQGYTNLGQMITDLDGQIRTLAQNGAKNILVPNMVPLGLSPAGQSQGPAVVAGLNGLASQFNSLLANELNTVSASLGQTIYTIDTFSAVTAIYNNPAAFGFTNVTIPVLAGAIGDGNASGYTGVPAATSLFYDAIHPTAVSHEAIAALPFIAVPEPTSAIMTAVGILVCGLGRFTVKRTLA